MPDTNRTEALADLRAAAASGGPENMTERSMDHEARTLMGMGHAELIAECQRLRRELNQAHYELDRAKLDRDKAERERDEAREQRNRLQPVVRTFIALCEDGDVCDGTDYATPHLETARAALADPGVPNP